MLEGKTQVNSTLLGADRLFNICSHQNTLIFRETKFKKLYLRKDFYAAAAIDRNSNYVGW
jgi:hypothetical protein